MAAGMVSTAHLTIRIIRRLLTAMFADRDRRIRTVGLALVTCILPATAIISVPTVASAQTTSTTPTVKIVSPLAGSCATGSTRNLQASFTGTGTVSYMSYFLNGAWEKQVNGAVGPWNYTGNYANGTYTLVAKATLTTGAVITSPAVTWSRLTTCPTTTTTTVAPATTTTAATTTTTIAPVTTTTTTPPSGTTTTTIATSGIPALRAIKITSPINGSCYETSLWNLEAQVTGDLTATEVHYYLDNAWHAYSTTAPWTHTENYAYGTYNLTAKATLSNGTIITSPQTTWTRGPTCPYEPPPTTTTTTTIPGHTSAKFSSPINGSCTTNPNITLSSTVTADGFADQVTKVTYNMIGNGVGVIVPANAPGPFTKTVALTGYDTYSVQAVVTWAGTTPPAPATQITFTYAPTCTPTTTTTLPPTTTTTTTTTGPPLPPPVVAINVPTGAIAGQAISVSVANASNGDSVSILPANQQPTDRFGSQAAGPTVQFSVPSRTLTNDTFRAVAFRNGAPVASSPTFTVTPTPTLSVTSPDDFYAGYRVTANLSGMLQPGDRVRIDTIGQSDACPACIELPATPTVTFPNSPTPGTYQMRLLRSGQTVAVTTFTTQALPTPQLTLWLESRYDWGSNITSACTTTGGKIFCPYDPALINYNPGLTESVPDKFVTVTGQPNRPGDFIEIGNGGNRVTPNQWFTGLRTPLQSNEMRYLGITYRTMLGGTDVPLGTGIETRWFFPVGGLSCPVATIVELERLTGKPYDPNATIDGVKYCNTGQIVYLDPITGQPLPAGQQPQPEVPNKPATPAPIAGNPNAHWLEHGNPTDLKNQSDWGCLTNSGTTLSYSKPGQGTCLVVEPIDQGNGTWQLMMVDDEIDYGCLSYNGTAAVLADPCGADSQLVEQRLPGPGYLMKLSPAGRTDLCLSSTLQFETCSSDNRQVWQDGPVEWLAKHKCAVSLLIPGGYSANICRPEDYKEIWKGVVSAVVDPVEGLITCGSNIKKAAQCTRLIYAITTPFPTPADQEIRAKVVTGMVNDCISNPEACIGEVIGNVLTGAVAAELKSIALAARTARLERAAAEALATSLQAEGKTAEAAAQAAKAQLKAAEAEMLSTRAQLVLEDEAAFAAEGIAPNHAIGTSTANLTSLEQDCLTTAISKGRVKAGATFRHRVGAMVEEFWYRRDIQAGLIPVNEPGIVNQGGIDYISFDKDTGIVLLNDAKYRKSKSFPTISAKQQSAWKLEAKAEIDSYVGPYAAEIKTAFENGKIAFQVKKYGPQGPIGV
jgi:hypothetical protein